MSILVHAIGLGGLFRNNFENNRECGIIAIIGGYWATGLLGRQFN